MKKSGIMSRIAYIKPLFLICFAIYLSSCNSGKPAVEAKETEEVLPEDIVEMRDDQISLAGIEFGKAEPRMMGSSLKVNGVVSVAPQNLATVCMPLGGFVKYTSLVPGSEVNKGQTLAVIENQDFVDLQQSYLEAKNKLVFAEAEFKRHSELYKDEVYSEKNVQQVTVEYNNLKAQVHSLGQKLKLIGINPDNLNEENISSTVNLSSPIKGFVRAANVNIGKYVSSTDVLFEIINSDKLYLELNIFEKDADKVVSGQKARFTIANESEEHQAVITQTGTAMSDDNTLCVYASVNDRCPRIKPGMYVSAEIEENGKQAMAVPEQAVVSFDDKDYIFIYEKDKTEKGMAFTEYRMVEVTKGVSSSGYTEIVAPQGVDLNAAKIVVKGAYNLLSAKKNAGEMAC
jgi:cobalt-zinc-cadmium efflux system membrane fusion protein